MLNITLEEFKAVRALIRIHAGPHWDRMAHRYGARRLIEIARMLPRKEWDEFRRIVAI